jgi:SAM-dependent methyltransferase
MLARMNVTGPADRWLDSPLGAAVLELETRLLQDELADVVGFELLQLGRWGDWSRLCEGARTQHRTLIAPDADGPHAIRAHFDALPIASNSVEAVLLPHTLEHVAHPHQLLREAERVLVGEGNVIICAFNPWGPWGARHYSASGNFPPHAARMLSERRTRDWLTLLGFEIVTARRYLFAPPWTQYMVGLQPGSWLEERGPTLASPLAGAYLLKARKRVHAVTPIRPAWTARPVLVGGAPEPTTRQAA